MKLSVIVPVFNEEKTIKTILDRLLEVPVVTEIVVVDDGSSDQTAELAEAAAKQNNISGPQTPRDALYPSSGVEASSHELPVPPRIKVIRHEKNRGKGAAIRTGLNHVSCEVVVIQDGDLEYDPKDFIRMLEVIKSGANVVYGSRILGNNRFSYKRYYLGGKFLSALSRFLYGITITDEPTCYKMARTDLLRKMNLRCTGFEFCPEMTAKAARLGETITEIPISYNPRSILEGKKIRWHDGITAVWTLLLYRFWKP